MWHEHIGAESKPSHARKTAIEVRHLVSYRDSTACK